MYVSDFHFSRVELEDFYIHNSFSFSFDHGYTVNA